MTISKLYSNKPDLFEPIEFQSALSVALAEIRLPENRLKDTHNLGKSTLGRLLDFCFLARSDQRFFLFKHIDLFKDFIFYLELRLSDDTYVTIRRSVSEASKISFKKHALPQQDFTSLPQTQWDHFEVPFERAKELLDSFLNWRGLKPWDFRKIIGYLLRSQDDYRDVFQLKKFASAHSEWKPFLAHILGFNQATIAERYTKEDQLAEKEATIATIKQELGGEVQDVGKIDGILILKRQEAEKKQTLLDAFDFRKQEKAQSQALVDDLDVKIADLNSRRYSLLFNQKKVKAALEEGQILFDPNEAEKLFKEAGILFRGQVKKDFEQLIEFNKAITEERHGYLLEERAEISDELKKVNADLNALGKERIAALAFLTESDSFAKYKRLSNDMVTLRADIEALERQRKFLHRLQELRTETRNLTEAISHLQSQIENDVDAQSADEHSLFSQIRLFFNDIVEEVLDRKALLSVSVNNKGHLEFKADILDETGKATSAGHGHTYRKLLCIAFDMALLRAHLGSTFPNFVYHDGVFESLDDRKKLILLEVIRRYADLGIQSIITLIDSDLPAKEDDESDVFAEEEIVLLLHDEGEPGRLFKMPEF